MGNLWQDIRYGARTLAHNPAFTAVVIVIIALGVGANAAIFNALDQLTLRPLPVQDPKGLVSVQNQWRSRDGHVGYGGIFNYPLYEAYRDRADVFSGLIAFSDDDMRVRIGQEVEELQALAVSGNYFAVLGVQPALGRAFHPEQEPDTVAHPVAIISDRLWRQRFGADTDVIGQQIVTGNQSLTIVGVIPPQFTGSVVGRLTDLYIPLGIYAGLCNNDIRRDTWTWLHFLGRLKPRVSRLQAQASLTILNGHLEAAGLDNVRENTLIRDGSRGWMSWSAKDLPRPLTLFMITAAFILAIACVNIANMQLSRAASRQKEIAVRQALGAGRWRVIRQLLVESLLLALAGGLCGIVLAVWLDGLVCALVSRIGSVSMNPGLDPGVLLFALAISLLTGLLFGLAPALQMAQRNVIPALKQSSGFVEAPRRRWNPHYPLIVVQVAFAVMVLVCAGLFIRSVIALHRIDPGYDTNRLLAVSLQGRTYNRPDLRRRVEDLYERIKGLPGTEASCLASAVPLGEAGSMRGMSHVDGVEIPENERISLPYAVVSPGYFKTLSMPLLAGRDFSALDTHDAPKVMVINDVMARRYWPHQSPLDKTVTFWGHEDGFTVRVVGVVQASKMRSIIEEQKPIGYLPLTQHPEYTPALLIRTTGRPQPLIPVIRTEVASFAPNDAWRIASVADRVARLLYPQHAMAAIFNAFALAGLLLCLAGLYSVIAYAVKQRTREIGIRMALGAEARHVVISVLRRGACLTAAGLTLGLALSFVAMRVLDSQLVSLRHWNKFMLFGVDAFDLLTMLAVPLLVSAAALLACYLPARRAAKIDPMQALRYE